MIKSIDCAQNNRGDLKIKTLYREWRTLKKLSNPTVGEKNTYYSSVLISIIENVHCLGWKKNKIVLLQILNHEKYKNWTFT